MIGHEGECLMVSLKIVKSMMVLFLILTSIMVAVSFAPSARASTSIASMIPTSGEVGSTVYLQANITTPDGPFEVRFDTAVRASGSAVGNYVNKSFTVPEATAGNYTVMVLDQTGQNATATFTITTSYSLKAEVPVAPKQLQEGDSVSINANVTGGTASASYTVNVTVTAPTGVSYTNLTTIFTSSVGSGNTILTYPKDFSTGANTNFTGTYRVYFNGTLANEAFFIGLTNSSQYHRHQTVDVKAMYASGENVTITIQGNIIYTSTTAQANSSGLVHYVNSTILSEASIGTYTVTIISISNPTKKTAAPDVQSFTVPGYSVNITLLNLAGAPVPSIILKITENGESISENIRKENGTVFLELEYGTYLCNATYSDVLVGQQALTIREELAFNLSCNLTSLNVIVTDEYATKLPEVNIYMIPGNQTLTTDINGTAKMDSMLPNVTYTLNVSRYDMLFITNLTIPSLPSTTWYDLPIKCPTMTLNINVTDARGRRVNDAAVEAQELLGGRYYSGTTANGAVSLNCTFGKYTVMVLIKGVTVNETTVSLNETSVNLPIVCNSYGFDVSVRAVDYFGQPMPNVNVTLQRSEWRDSRMAGGDGLATFGNTFGGDLNVTIRLAGQSEPSVVSSVSVDNSTPIEIKIDRYVLLAGMIVEASQLLAVVIVLIVAVLFLSVEVFRRRWRRPKKNEV
jgi:hypothetical protein